MLDNPTFLKKSILVQGTQILFFIIDFQKLSAEPPVHFWLKKCGGVALKLF